jgi:hypothetical protein
MLDARLSRAMTLEKAWAQWAASRVLLYLVLAL